MDPASVQPEGQVLLACCRPRLDPDRSQRLVEAAGRVSDWDDVIRASLRHSIMPLVYRHLLSVCPDLVPDAAMQRLKGLFYKNVARNSFLTAKLFEIQDLLQDHGVRLMPVKGPTIAQALYGDIALRRFDDLDFIIHPEDILGAREVLLDAGFQPHLELSHAEAKAHVRTGWEMIFKRPEDDYSIELDTGVAPRYFSFFIGAERLWQSFETVTIQERPVRTLSPENLCLYLCAHGTKHCWSRLVWIADVATLIETYRGTDWRGVLNRAYGLGAYRMVLLGLALARDLAGAVLTEDVDREVNADRVVRHLSSQVAHSLWDTGDLPRRGLDDLLFHLSARERLRDRIRYAWRVAVTPTYSDWKSVPLPEPLFFLYYAVRPFRLAWRGARALRKKKARV